MLDFKIVHSFNLNQVFCFCFSLFNTEYLICNYSWWTNLVGNHLSYGLSEVSWNLKICIGLWSSIILTDTFKYTMGVSCTCENPWMAAKSHCQPQSEEEGRTIETQWSVEIDGGSEDTDCMTGKFGFRYICEWCFGLYNEWGYHETIINLVSLNPVCMQCVCVCVCGGGGGVCVITFNRGCFW